MPARKLVVFELVGGKPGMEGGRRSACEEREDRWNEKAQSHGRGQSGGLHVATAATQRYGSRTQRTELFKPVAQQGVEGDGTVQWHGRPADGRSRQD
jgi:hypothetical protein